jgi:hypothetical protein
VNSSAVFLALLSFQLWRFSLKELLAIDIDFGYLRGVTDRIS